MRFAHHAMGALLYLFGFLIAFSVLPILPNSIANIMLGAVIVFFGAFFEFHGRKR